MKETTYLFTLSLHTTLSFDIPMSKHLGIIFMSIIVLISIENMLLARKNVSKLDQIALTAFEKKGMLRQQTNINIGLKALMRRLFTEENQRKRKSGFFSIKIDRKKLYDLITEVLGDRRHEIKETRNKTEKASNFDADKDSSFLMDLKWFNRIN